MAKPKKTSKTSAAKAEATETVTEAAAPEKSKAVALVVNKAALRVDYGQTYVNNALADAETGDQIKELTGRQTNLRQENMALITLAWYEAHKADESVTPYAVFEAPKDWRDALARMYVVLGLRNTDGSLTDLGRRFMPDVNATDAEKETPAYKRAESRRNNLATFAKKGAMQAVYLLDNKITPTFDPEHHTLKLEGAPVAIRGRDKSPVLLTGSTRPGAESSASFETMKQAAIAKHDPEKAKSAKGKAGGSETTVGEMAREAATDDKSLSAACNLVIAAVNTMDGQVTKSQRNILANLMKNVGDFLETAKDV